MNALHRIGHTAARALGLGQHECDGIEASLSHPASTNHEGSLEGLAAISVPIRAGQQAPIGAIALSMRAEKLDARAEQRLIPVLFESARLIEAEFATATAPN